MVPAPFFLSIVSYNRENRLRLQMKINKRKNCKKWDSKCDPWVTFPIVFPLNWGNKWYMTRPRVIPWVVVDWGEIFVIKCIIRCNDSALDIEILSLMNEYSRYNQIFIVEEDIPKTTFRCLCDFWTFDRTMMYL